MTNPLRSPEDYELFLYTLAEQHLSIRASTITFVRRGSTLARVAGELSFDYDLRCVIRERLLYDRLPAVIDEYGYEVWRGADKLYWYDSQPHPNDESLQSTHPHHKHIPPDLKHHRIPAPHMSFTQPNLPTLIEEIEGLLGGIETRTAMNHSFKWQESRTEYREERSSKHGTELRWLVNRETILNRATGKTTTRGTIRHPAIAVIVPFLADDQLVLMRQYRYAADEVLWELPAGTLNGREQNGRMIPTETPAECAARELLEETGYEAARWEQVGECYAMPGMSDELMHVFFAHELTQREQALDDDEMIYEVRAFSGTELTAMIGRGEIRDAKTLVGLFVALSRRPGGVQI